MYSSAEMNEMKKFFFYDYCNVSSFMKVESYNRDLYFSKVMPSLRYADSTAWILLECIDKLLKSQNCYQIEYTDVGIILISDYGTLDTIHRFHDDAQNGFISPLRFVASNPASTVGFVCTYLNIHGPTLTLPTPLENCESIISIMLQKWFKRQNLEHIIVASLQKDQKNFTCKSILIKKDYQYKGYSDFAPEFFRKGE
ncbi:MAG: hypothetical protein EHM58_01460 [Ignavibacteriae bacterium]|nr:MAG: hypothetical protein EHM58_01460 [Ignavibacteriota bacterium]